MKKEYYQLDRVEMLDFVQMKPTTCLDVGCGEGNFGKVLKQHFGSEVWGIEPVESAAQVAAQKLDNVIHDFFHEELLPDHHFDLISFNDVLEHMNDPWKTLVSCKSKLTSKGHILASIPNILYFHDFMNMLLTKDWKYEEAGIFDRTHLRFFTKKSTIRLFEESGYEIVSIHGIRPTDSKKFTLFNLATLGYWKEAQFLQFAVYAKPKEN